MDIPNLLGFYRDGLFRRRVITISTASTGYNIKPGESGTIFVIGSATTMFVRLPRPSSRRLGLTYEFLVRPQSSAADVSIMTATGSSALIFGVGTSGSTLNSGGSVRPDTTQIDSYGRVTALTSAVYFLEQALSLIANSSAELLSTQIGTGPWSTGSTSS